MRSSFALPLLLLCTLCLNASAQKPKTKNLEFSGGYLHASGNQGLNGFDVGAAAWFSNNVSVAFDYDGVFNTSNIGMFQITQTGQVISKAHLQDYLIGPRIFLPNLTKGNEKFLKHAEPFGEAQFGESHLGTSLSSPTQNINQSTSDTAFSWMLGGGLDYRTAPHWVARIKVDLLRTHFADAGQSRLRFGLELAYLTRGRTR